MLRARGLSAVLSSAPSPDDEPITAEIFSVERLEEHAAHLAHTQEVSPHNARAFSLSARLRENSSVLSLSYQALLAGMRNGHGVTPAAEWLIDNYYVVDEHVRAIRRDLPPGYYKQLPKLANGPWRGYPRVYGLAWAIVAHTDNRFELDTLARFCRAYQRVQPLTIGELWAIAITLRVVLIDNLRRLASGITHRLTLREEANSLADKILPNESGDSPLSRGELRKVDDRPLPDAFAAQLFQRLRDQDPASTPALAWLYKRLAARSTTADAIVRSEHQRQGAVNVSIRNVITSLKLISSVNWAKFVESVSLVDDIMRTEGGFSDFDFATRDLYRHAIEELARYSAHSELDVARHALAAAARSTTGVPREREAGYYLIAEGRTVLENELEYRVPWSQRLGRWTRGAGVAGYAGSIAGLSALGVALAFAMAGTPHASLAWSSLTAALAFLAASETATTLVNLWVVRVCHPQPLPALELADGVPRELRTLLAVPVLLTDLAEVEAQVRSLEVHFLATQDGDVYFALLSDWLDSPSETSAEDEPLLSAAQEGIARLNRIHGSLNGEDRFLLLHRKRQWNSQQNSWMGWERKRGKLHELNRLLLGAANTSFVVIGGKPPHVPDGVQYVISLDSDTRLPRGAALNLVGKMAHPLNRPVVDASHRRVIDGYGILQPRVTPSLPTGSGGSLFQRVFSGSSGIDPYAFAVSDVYQDLFGEGSYTGKGIYDVAVFEATLDARVADNRLLSHDLFEGVFARCGLASDVEVVEEYPSHYGVASARLHRWTRGDWQLLPWLLGLQGDVPALGLWKMLDNLRRSLLVPASVAAFFSVWAGRAPSAWSLMLLAALTLPVLIPLAIRLVPRAQDLSSRGYRVAARNDLRQTSWLIALRLVFWADSAAQFLDAILRALYRMVLSRRNLLEWRTAAQSKAGASSSVADAFRSMSGSLLACAGMAAFLAFGTHSFPWVAAPFLALWICAPWIARYVSLPPRASGRESLTAGDRDSLRAMARQTWNFFDVFVTAEHHMLPPDNFQEIPNPVVANRTSPTNIGLYLLSVVAARDFGWIGSLDALERLEKTFSTLQKLERYRGHFFNWYDTHDLRALDPKYISTVDSGNLAGHLLTVEGALREWRSTAASIEVRLAGIADAFEQLARCVRSLRDDRRNYGVTPRQIETAAQGFRDALTSARAAAAVHAQIGTAQAAPLRELEEHAVKVRDLSQALTDEHGARVDPALLAWSKTLLTNIGSHLAETAAAGASDLALEARTHAIAEQARALALSMEFGFLVEPERQLLTIGYRVTERSSDVSCYDLLASEARLASFIAIAKGDLPVRHWFRLGRLLAPVDASSALVSWSGSMFEYLMPVLVMREPAGSLLGNTAEMVVRRQIEYGAERNLPWGVSESAFNARDRELTYQYSSFGVPGLGLQRGLGEEAVVAPYATALAAMVDPKSALRNFERLQHLGGRGRYGWYDALDFTPSRLPEGTTVAPVRAYMAHHQGMVLVSIANVLLNGMMRERFHAAAIVRATELLLQERTPRDSNLSPPSFDSSLPSADLNELSPAAPRRFTSVHHAAPRTHVLSNGNYSVMVTAAGSGYSRWRDTAVTRWREDSTCDSFGYYIFLRDVSNGQVWSAGYQPIGREPDRYEAAFFEDHAEIVRNDGPIVTTTEVVVSTEDDAEVRRVSITNTGNRAREIELTTYSEVVLTAPDADAAHPAFAKMFVQTEFVPETGTLLATRRTREASEPKLWAAHLSVLTGTAVGGLQFETDRARFLGRGHTLRNAVSVVDARPLSNTAGTVLDPVLALRRRVRIEPRETVRVAFWLIVAPTRTLALSLADKHRDNAAFDRAKTLAWTQAQVQLRYLGIDFEAAQLFQQIANRVLFSDASLRPPRDVLARNAEGPAALWAFGISGDLPIVLLRIDDENDFDIVKQLLRAHEYWRLKRLAVDLVILNDKPPSYASDLQLAIDAAIRTSQARNRDQAGASRGGIFSLRGDLMPVSGTEVLQNAARAIFVARRGTLADQLARLRDTELGPRPRRMPPGSAQRTDAPRANPALEYFNGFGGFDAAGREYVTLLNEEHRTPAPWINVIANPQFGFQVSTECVGSTYSLNARENQLTPWSNDPVSDTPSEAIYLRDEQTGDLWSATPLPIRQPAYPYLVRHGFGYTRFEHSSHGIALDLLLFVPLEDAVKISRLRVTNGSAQVRQLSITGYLEWVLGNQRSRTAPFIITEIEPRTGALLARNPWRTEFQSRIVYYDMGGRQQSVTADRAEFLGRHGSLSEPAVLLGGQRLSNRTGGGLDPCGALQSRLTLQPGESIELRFLLGEAADKDAAVAALDRYRASDLDGELKAVKDFWERTLGVVQVKTPDRSIDILLNGWLLYQTLVCRVWARCGFYQSSGAYGFRDQLQDVMALLVAQPVLAREHILRAAARQFMAGDVQHWWLPTSGQGVQTRISDDRIWLPFAVAQYLDVTGDDAILKEDIPFLEGAALAPEQHELFAAPATSATTATLFEHCVLALDSSLNIGSHGLPLFGSGDWNDGMNRVGVEGKGESVWLGWFLHATLMSFAPIAESCGAQPKAAMWRKHAFGLQQAIEREAWDGDWYRRGYYDDGTPLGSVSSDECRIDAIAQSWAVISGGGDPARATRAMSAVNTQLVSRSEGLVKLFTPPFDHSRHDPGYIEAYPPGLRENGGQYTHAAMWTTLAFALMGDGDRAGELFSLLNPINHASTRAGIHRYKVEPYVVCADLYSADAHVGRGGWTWYTGSAGWMYRAATEGILGIRLRGRMLAVDPCIPHTWPGFEVTFKHGNSRYRIAVENPGSVCRGVLRATLDDKDLPSGPCEIPLIDDGHYHYARITLGRA